MTKWYVRLFDVTTNQVAENSFDRSEGSPMNPWVGDVFVSILPCWHIFERTAEYFMLTRGATMVGGCPAGFGGGRV